MSLPPLHVHELLRKYGLRPDKRLGQNFLVDPSALEQVVGAADPAAQDMVLEVGPGLGSLTRLLAERVSKVVAVEIDARLLPALQAVLEPYPNVQIIAQDILAFHPAQAGLEPGYLVVANIPYYITSALIRHLLEAEVKPKRIVLTVQREVAERITAGPGDMSLLALSVQVYGRAEITTHIPAGAFYPVPNVDSAVVRVDLYPSARLPVGQLDVFFQLAKAGFSQKRKTLRNALAGGLHWSPGQIAQLLESASIDPQRRAESLSLQEWEQITRLYGSFKTA